MSFLHGIKDKLKQKLAFQDSKSDSGRAGSETSPATIPDPSTPQSQSKTPTPAATPAPTHVQASAKPRTSSPNATLTQVQVPTQAKSAPQPQTPPSDQATPTTNAPSGADPPPSVEPSHDHITTVKPCRLDLGLSIVDKRASQELKKAQEKLTRAIEELEGELQATTQPSRDKLPQLKSALDTAATGDVPSSLSDIVSAAQGDVKVNDEKLGSRVGRFFLALYPSLQLTLKIAGDVGSIGSFLPVQIVASGLTQVVELALNPLNQDRLVKDGLETLTRDDALVRELQQFPTSTYSDAMLIGAIELQVALLNFLRESISWSQNHYLGNIVRGAVGKKPIEESITALKEARSLLTTSVVNETFFMTKRQEIREAQNELLSKICSNDLLNASLDDQAKWSASRAPKTGLWFLCQSQAYTDWSENKLSALWCTGSPGTGKTYLSSIVIDQLESHLDQENNALAYVYCKRERAQLQTVETILGLIIRQFCARKPSLCFDSTYKARLAERNLPLQTRKDLLKSLILQFKGTIIVVDALDEFSLRHEDQLFLMDTLIDITGHFVPEQCRFLVMSREASDVWEAMWTLDRDKVTITAAVGDLNLMVDKWLESKPRFRRLLENEKHDGKTLKEYAVSKLQEKSRGVCKLAQLQFERASYQGGVSDIVKCLDNLSQDIDDYYKDWMLEIRKRKDQEILVRLLTWIFCAKQPLHLRELAVGLGITARPAKLSEVPRSSIWNIAYFIGEAEGLLNVIPTVEANNDIVAPAHATVSEYFERNPAELDPAGHNLVIHACLNFWSTENLIELLPEIYGRKYGLQSDRRARHWFKNASLEWVKSREDCDTLRSEEVLEKITPFAMWALHLPSWLTTETLQQDSGGEVHEFLGLLSVLNAVDTDDDVVLQDAFDWCVWHDWDVFCGWLMAYRAPANIEDRGKELLNLAIVYPSPQTAKTLAAAEDININSFLETFDQTSLTEGSREIFPDVLEVMLLRDGVDPNTKNRKGKALLHDAARDTYPRFVDVLLAHPDIDVNIPDNTKCTPLMYSMTDSASRFTLAKLIGRKGININLQNLDDRTALSFAASGGMTPLRLRQAKDLMAAAKTVHQLHEFFHQKPVLLLLGYGAKVDLVDKKRRSPLDYAKELSTMVEGWAPQNTDPSTASNVDESSSTVWSAEQELIPAYIALRKSIRSTVAALERVADTGVF